MKNKHNMKKRVMAALCIACIMLPILCIPTFAIVNSSQVADGQTGLYGQSTFPYSVGFVMADQNLARNYIFATDIGSYGLNNNQTYFGEDQFDWHYPDSTDTETSLIEYSDVNQQYLRDDLRWYTMRSIEYGSNFAYFFGGVGGMRLEYYTNTQDFDDIVESIVFKAQDVYYNPISTLKQLSTTTFAYRNAPEGYEYLVPCLVLPTLTNYSTQALVGSYSVECSILDDKGETHRVSYSVPIDTRNSVPTTIPFLSYNTMKQFITLNSGGEIVEASSSKTILITEYRGYFDVEFYEYSDNTWSANTTSRIKNQIGVTFPMYDTSNAQGATPYLRTYLDYPSATKMINSSVGNIDVDNPAYENIPTEMYHDYTGWIGNAVSGFLGTQIFPGITLAGIVGVIVMFGCAIALLKIFAGG